jgi:5-methylcytosine-specific restriction endonuclease McrA
MIENQADQLPAVEELHDLVLHALQSLGGSARKEGIYSRIVRSDLTPSRKRKFKFRFKRALTDLERHGLLENSGGFLIAKREEAEPPERVPRYSTGYVRSPAIRAAVMKRAKGKCEFCGEPGFTGVDGTPYLECHHIVALANDGVDRMINVIALCANHHREAHFGEQRDEIEKRMIRIVEKAERNRGLVHFARSKENECPPLSSSSTS